MGRKTTLWRCAADAWGPVAVTASEAGRRPGVSVAPGCLLGWPRELGRPAAARATWAGWLLRASGPSRPSQLRAFFPSFSFFCFIFLLLCLNSNLV